MVIKVLDEVNASEMLRSEVYNYGDYISQYYINEFRTNNIIPIGAYLGNTLIGALYLTPHGNIDQVFVKPEYQFSNYHVGSSLLIYVEDHLNELLDYGDLLCGKLYISPTSDKAERVYKSLGYRGTRLDGTLSKRVK